mmetsp:Transcript_294/g.1037  ORF Transcript_294/g.1037 Transcript_294/m.1037 type:complete len:276 (+) Transcript_294:903-1730(+)
MRLFACCSRFDTSEKAESISSQVGESRILLNMSSVPCCFSIAFRFGARPSDLAASSSFSFSSSRTSSSSSCSRALSFTSRWSSASSSAGSCSICALYACVSLPIVVISRSRHWIVRSSSSLRFGNTSSSCWSSRMLRSWCSISESAPFCFSRRESFDWMSWYAALSSCSACDIPRSLVVSSSSSSVTCACLADSVCNTATPCSSLSRISCSFLVSWASLASFFCCCLTAVASSCSRACTICISWNWCRAVCSSREGDSTSSILPETSCRKSLTSS